MAQTLLTARRFTVERREYTIPGQGLVSREVVIHPGAVLIVPVLPDGRVVMIHNYRFSVERELLELPAGTLESPEPPIECAVRELEEETGYVAESIEPLAAYYTTPGFTNELMYAFVATGLTATQQRLEGTEQIRVEPMPLAEALRAASDGRIMDAKTIAALFLYHHRDRGRT